MLARSYVLSSDKKKRKKRLEPISMAGLSVEDALAGAMGAPPLDDKAKPKKRKARKAKKKRET